MLRCLMNRFAQAYETMAEKADEAEKQEEEQDSTAFRSFLEDFAKNLPQLQEPGGPPGERAKLLDDLSLSGVAKYIKDGRAKSIIVMSGAGISTSAGIPDFRSPNTGIYAQVAGKYDLPDPQALFEIGYFLRQPEPFYAITKEAFFTKLKPTPCHYFIRLLYDKGLLTRTFTQNIDTLEHVVGIPEEYIIEAHGTMHSSTCLTCREKYSLDWLKEQIGKGVPVPRCEKEDSENEKCEGLVKPDVVFFGESLPTKFFVHAQQDFPKCDLLLIMGTSLLVQPFCSLVDKVGNDVPRVLINRDKVGQRNILERLMGMKGLDFDDENNVRDVFYGGNCDDGCMELAKLLGWEQELKDLIESEWKRIDKEHEMVQEKKSEAEGGVKESKI